MKKILVFKIGALGDILMATPFLRELRAKNKNAQIDFLVGDNAKIILKNNQYIDNILEFDHKIFFKKKLLNYYKLSKKIKKEKYDEIYVLDKHWIFHLFAYLTKIPKRVGLIRDKISEKFLTEPIYRKGLKHEVDFYLSLIKSNTKNKKLYYNLDKKVETKIKLKLKKEKIKDYVIAINDGGANGVEEGGIRKLPDEKFNQLLELISKENKVLLIGGPNLKDYYKNFTNKNIINIAGCSLDESFAYLKFAKRVYTTDCGPMHMAACINDNITCFFGPTNPKRKAPLVKGVVSIWDDEDIYEEAYEIDGTLPDKNKKFFKKLNIGDLK